MTRGDILLALLVSWRESTGEDVGANRVVDAVNEARVRHDDLLDPIIAAFVAALTQEEALAHFAAADVTVCPICDIADLMEYHYVVEREVMTTYPDPEIGSMPTHHVSPRLNGTPGAIHAPAPNLGEHTETVLAAIGLGPETVAALRERGGV